jgi:TatD DNase family protein
MIIDTHCHLNHEQFTTDVPHTIERARQAGVEKMIVVGYDLPSSEAAVLLAERYQGVYAAVAIHPHDAKHYDDSAENRLLELAASKKVAAIGEIGLDYHYDFSPVEAQKAAFRAQIALAHKTALPVIIHCREAYGDVLDMLETEGIEEIGGVMHCWAGDAEQAERTLKLGMYLGIGGVVTFKNAALLREITAATPLDRILLETDAPYLAPMPYRGKRNEPAYTSIIAEKVAKLRGMPREEIEAATTANACNLFRFYT